jgi:hypothetical protein
MEGASNLLGGNAEISNGTRFKLNRPLCESAVNIHFVYSSKMKSKHFSRITMRQMNKDSFDKYKAQAIESK